MAAQDASAQAAASGDIVVVGRRPDDRSIVDDQTEATVLDAQRLQATGATTITELLRRLGPMTVAPGGQEPLILVNGRPIMGDADLATLPPEAIEQMQVVNERSAPRFGATPDRRVVNLVLQRRFRSSEATPGVAIPTGGGGKAADLAVQGARLMDRKRVSASIRYRHQDVLAERDRGIDGGSPEDGLSRSLLPQNDSWSASGTATVPVGATSTASLSMATSHNRTQSILAPSAGLARSSTGEALRQRTENRSYSWTAMIGGLSRGWMWNVQASANRFGGDGRLVDPGTGALTQRSTSRSTNAGGDARVSGTLLTLPAGPLHSALFLRFARNWGTSGLWSRGIGTAQDIAQSSIESSATLTVPLLSPKTGPVRRLGSLTATITAGVSRLTGLRPAPRFDGGLQWAPIPILTVSGSWSVAQQAVPADALLRPLVRTPNVPVFDFVNAQTVLVDVLTGGNPALRGQRHERRSATLSVRPWPRGNLAIDLSYSDASTFDPSLSLTAPTPLVAAVFADRFIRDADGRLIEVDSRPLNLFRARRSEVSGGVPLFLPLGASSRPPVPIAPSSRPSGPARQLTLNLRPSLTLADRLLLRRNGPSLDLLRGDSLSGAGGQSRVSWSGQAAYSAAGATVSIDGQIRGATRVRNIRPEADLRFGGLFVMNLGLTLPVGKLAPDSRISGAQATIDINNVFNRRQIVRDGNGDVPDGFQPAYRDPQGRTITVRVRIRF